MRAQAGSFETAKVRVSPGRLRSSCILPRFHPGLCIDTEPAFYRQRGSHFTAGTSLTLYLGLSWSWAHTYQDSGPRLPLHAHPSYTYSLQLERAARLREQAFLPWRGKQAGAKEQ